MLVPEYSDRDQDQIIREYFGPTGVGETPLCPQCGETLQFDSRYPSHGSGIRIEVSCPNCQRQFMWEQTQPEQSWKPLHLEYFLERIQSGALPRCPIDDCYVTHVDFGDGVLEFRCPCCNRRGKIDCPPV